MHSEQGANPWDIGALGNFKSVMGNHFWDWVLPIKQSPCANHDRSDAEFPTGPVVERMKKEARQYAVYVLQTQAQQEAAAQNTTQRSETTISVESQKPISTQAVQDDTNAAVSTTAPKPPPAESSVPVE